MNLKNLNTSAMTRMQSENWFRFEAYVAAYSRFFCRHLLRKPHAEKKLILIEAKSQMKTIFKKDIDYGTALVRTITQPDTLDAYLVVDFNENLDLMQEHIKAFKEIAQNFISFNVVAAKLNMYQDEFEASEKGEIYTGRIELTLPFYFEPIDVKFSKDSVGSSLEHDIGFPDIKQRMLDENMETLHFEKILYKLMQTKDSNGSDAWCPGFWYDNLDPENPEIQDDFAPPIYVEGAPYSRKIFSDHISDILEEEGENTKFLTQPLNTWFQEHNLGEIHF